MKFGLEINDNKAITERSARFMLYRIGTRQWPYEGGRKQGGNPGHQLETWHFSNQDIVSSYIFNLLMDNW